MKNATIKKLRTIFVFMFVVSCFATISQAEVCSIKSYVTDLDPAGLNVRIGPGSKYEIIGVIPTKLGVGATLTIIEAKNNWMKIRDIFILDAGNQPKLPKSGWVYGGLVGIAPQNVPEGKTGDGLFLFESPSHTSKKAAMLTYNEQDGYDIVKRLLDCSGKWLKIGVQNSKTNKRKTGWLHPDHQCGNPLSTCTSN